MDAVFGDGTSPVYVGVTDVTHEKSYPRQTLLAVPFALKVPVDGMSVVYDGTGKLSVGAVDAATSRVVFTRYLDDSPRGCCPALMRSESMLHRVGAGIHPRKRGV